MSAIIDYDVDFSQLSLDEHFGYLYCLLLAFKSEAIEVLNDDNKPDIAKFLYCFVLADSIAETFECVRDLLMIVASSR